MNLLSAQDLALDRADRRGEGDSLMAKHFGEHYQAKLILWWRTRSGGWFRPHEGRGRASQL